MPRALQALAMAARLGAELLLRSGYQATAVTRPTEALALIRSAPDSFDLVLTDLAMPGMSGTDLARRLREIRLDLPVILMTGFTANLTEANLREYGISEILAKPPTARTLASMVHRVLNKT